MEAQSQIENLKKLNIAASMQAHNIYPSLFQLIGYRQRLAQDLLKNEHLREDDSLNFAITYVNEQICDLLAIPNPIQ